MSSAAGALDHRTMATPTDWYPAIARAASAMTSDVTGARASMSQIITALVKRPGRLSLVRVWSLRTVDIESSKD